MNPIDTDSDRWEVTAASNTLSSSSYLVVHHSFLDGRIIFKEAVKVIVLGRKRRHYVWDDPARAKEKVPDLVRREIDRALVRYLTSTR